MKLLVTGGAGFIGSNFILYWLKQNPNDEIVNVDKLTYAADLSNLDGIKGKYSFVKGDITDMELMDRLVKESDAVVNFAAESFVDASINDSSIFVKSNIMGVHSILEAVRKYNVRFHHVSTDEVYGAMSRNSKKKFNEKSRYDPRNPYSATKAGGDLLIKAYYNTYKVPVTISTCTNNYGPFQHQEKLIPKTILFAMNDKKIPVYKDGKQIREWIYVEDHCAAIATILKNGKHGETYGISTGDEIQNIQIINMILGYLGKPASLIEFVKDRPGHDQRYALDSSKIRKELGWAPKCGINEYLKVTTEHYRQNAQKYLKGTNL